ncbi:4a-hydroxytetrahydrobiopterin dehydratase [Oxalobacteraceae bacterium CAVE-383]|nr:4a-hydroxytetrahydrobiopterin dehydratase [Oxalobacteraceae bacterium CAVE-383]
MSSPDLIEMKCTHQTQALSAAEVERRLAELPDWTLDNGKLTRRFAFGDYYETLAFINAIAYVIHAEDHHPELTVTYNRCVVRFDTHSVNNGKGGLSINDFICAAKVNAIFQQSFS